MAVKNIQIVQEVQKGFIKDGRANHVVRIDVHHHLGYKQILLSDAASWREEKCEERLRPMFSLCKCIKTQDSE